MTVRVDVKPALLTWAIDRSGLEPSALHQKFKKLDAWLAGTARPTLKQLENFARSTYTPIVYLRAEEPPDEPMPIPDFRNQGNGQSSRISVNLRDTIYNCLQRQDWYREYALREGLESMDFIGSMSVDTAIEQAAKQIRVELNFELSSRKSFENWEDAFHHIITQSDDAGIFVMFGSIVVNNTRRKHDLKEFRGFSLSDKYAPMVFINTADTLPERMFTLIHEIAHLWLGETALSNTVMMNEDTHLVEKWCKAVAIEFLVPMTAFRAELKDEPLDNALIRLADHFKVSSLVVLRRMADAGTHPENLIKAAFIKELERMKSQPNHHADNFYYYQPHRATDRFAKALISSTHAGQTLYRDAMRLLGVRKVSTLDKLGRQLGLVER